MTTKYYAPFKKDGLGAQLSWLTKGCERRNREAARRESGFATVFYMKQNKTKQNKHTNSTSMRSLHIDYSYQL